MSKHELILISALLFFLSFNLTNPVQAQQPQTSAAGASAQIVVAAGTRVEMLVTRPVWAATAKAGDAFYAQTSFPVVEGSTIAIPAGSYVKGTIKSVTRPTRRTNRAQIDVLFTQIVFADGYVVPLQGGIVAASDTSSAVQQSGVAETLISINIQATTGNDLLLDNGADVEMTLAAPLALISQLASQAIPLSRAPQPELMKSASRCTYIPGTPGTPGTPDTVVPGTPGTPSTTIPGGPGMPDTVIPGTPATPDTVIPGTPGTPGFPGTVCPPKPLVISCTPVEGNKQALAVPPAAPH